MSNVSFQITEDEALVLFSWLSENENIADEGSAEQRVLWSFECALEKALVEPLKDDYRQLVEKAKERILQE